MPARHMGYRFICVPKMTISESPGGVFKQLCLKDFQYFSNKHFTSFYDPPQKFGQTFGFGMFPLRKIPGVNINDHPPRSFGLGGVCCSTNAAWFFSSTFSALAHVLAE